MSIEDRLCLLNEAKLLLDKVYQSFPNESITCECCGMKTFKSWNEKQMRDELGGALTRVEKIRDRLTRIDKESQKD